MAVNKNADDYANARVGIFFPASSTPWPGTSKDGDLTGQCVTLNKWFLAEMCKVPGAFDARGHARSVGRTLVAQGHAYEVSRAEAKRGDFVVYEYGEYGHIAVLCSGGNIFQENAQVPGVASRIVAGSRVYAATIVPMYNTLGGVAPRFYRIKTYVENEQKESGLMIIQNQENWYQRCNGTHQWIRGRVLDRAVFNGFVGQDFLKFVEACEDDPEAVATLAALKVGQLAVKDNWQKQIYDLQAQLKAMGSRPTQAQLDALTKQVTELKTSADTANKKADEAEAKAKKLQDQAQIDYEAGKSVFRRIGIMLGLIKE